VFQLQKQLLCGSKLVPKGTAVSEERLTGKTEKRKKDMADISLTGPKRISLGLNKSKVWQVQNSSGKTRGFALHVEEFGPAVETFSDAWMNVLNQFDVRVDRDAVTGGALAPGNSGQLTLTDLGSRPDIKKKAPGADVSLTLQQLDSVEARLRRAGRILDREEFEISETELDDPCDPQKAPPVLEVPYYAVTDANFNFRPYQVELEAALTSDSFTEDSHFNSPVWTATPSNPTIVSLGLSEEPLSAVVSDIHTGGLYRFNCEAYEGEKTLVQVSLPLAGAEIKNWLKNELDDIYNNRARQWHNAVASASAASILIDAYLPIRYETFVFWRASAVFNYVGQAYNADKTAPCKKYSHGDSAYTDPAYMTLCGVVVHRSKLNNILWAFWGRRLGYSLSALLGGSELNQISRTLQKFSWSGSVANFQKLLDTPSAHNAIKLGSKLYDSYPGSIDSIVGVAGAKSIRDLPALREHRLWPCPDLVGSNTTLIGPWAILPTSL
jgi:hypothetical protein